MSFFQRGKRASDNKVKKNNKKRNIDKSSKNNVKKLDDELSSEEESGLEEDIAEQFSSDEETEQEKRLRLTKKYLKQIEKEELDKNVDDTRDAISQRLKDEALEQAGRLQKKRAHEYENCIPDLFCQFRAHKLSVTCLVVSSSENFIFSGSKDGSIIKWSLTEKKRLKTVLGGKKNSERYSGHTDHVLSLALSSDDKFLASGSLDRRILIWNPETMELLRTFRGHKDAISGLAFQKGSHQLISASSDRSLKLWNLDEMGYVETLFGHQDAITGIDCFSGETALTSGGRDNSIRIWKIVEESQLVFQAHGASIDCVCASSHQSFISGCDDGSLLFWGVKKKKPMSKIAEAHGVDPETEEPNWITSLCTLQNTDLLASGSYDGFIRLWRRDDDTHSLQPVARIPVDGFVNSMNFSKSGNYLIVGIGQEHRLGRWRRFAKAKNSIVIFSWNKR